ncbi:MAG TPA: M14 family zinc carboxypeptidase [Holophagaceae bacterium]|nr:M14 family zinc carboxypeptidase [Holophagaceae bacterium]
MRNHLLLPGLTLALAAPLAAQVPPEADGPWRVQGQPLRPGVPPPPAALGLRYTPHEVLVDYARRLAEGARDRVRLEVMNVTEEGREQLLLFITHPDNLARLEALQAANAKLADPRGVSSEEAQRIAAENPAFVWLGYSIHGAEPSGSEASLGVAYHFAASADPAVLDQLKKVVIILDLTQNPDGRARLIRDVEEATQGVNPADPEDIQNRHRWPSGRFNHRLFDLNRDWAWQTQGETRAKTAAFRRWNPQVLADHHEMGSESTYYFPPTMAPLHAAIPDAFKHRWQHTFGTGVARAFDAQGWAYFSRDVFDLFYPSYGDSWPSLQGAVGMTFEMAGQAGLAYQRKDGEVLTLLDRVKRHYTASLATVATAAGNRQALLSDYAKVRRDQVARGAAAGAFLLGEGADPGRTLELVRLLQRNGIEVSRTTAAVGTGLEPIAVDRLEAKAPSGSYLIALDQPRGALAQALLEKEAVFGPKPSYDVTAWSLPLNFGVPAWFAKTRPAVATEPWKAGEAKFLPEAKWGYLLPAGVEGREATLASLLHQGFRAWSIPEEIHLMGAKHEAGAVMIRPGKKQTVAELVTALRELTARNGHPALPLDGAQVELGPDLGSGRIRPLGRPRIAVLTDRPSDPTALGAVMHTLRETGLAFTQIRASDLGRARLSKFTHLILVDDNAAGQAWKATLGDGARMKAWVQDGGCLIGLQGGAIFTSRTGLLQAGFRFLQKGAEEARLKEKDPKKEPEKPKAEDLTQPWGAREDRALKESIPGSLLRVKVDGTHPLAWGLHGGEGAVLNLSDPILELSPGGENPLHFPKASLKVSGLLAPPLEEKLQNTAYALRESLGMGAVVAFAGDPVFRANQPYTRRAFLNAIFFGPYQSAGEE